MTGQLSLFPAEEYPLLYPAKAIDVTEVPSLSALRRAIYQNPVQLSQRRLLSSYGKILAYLSAWDRNLLPDEYWRGATTHASTGRVPADMWLVANAKHAKRLFYAELEERDLVKKYTFWIEI